MISIEPYYNETWPLLFRESQSLFGNAFHGQFSVLLLNKKAMLLT